MKKLLLSAGLLVASFSAAATTVDISLWSQENSPNYNRTLRDPHEFSM